MKSFAKLIHKSYMTYLPTKLPVQFYGLPDGKVYIIYARFYGIRFGMSDLEYVFAEHNDFRYDYEKEVLIPVKNHRAPVYSEMVDNPDPSVKILKVYRDINSYAEAVEILNKKAQEIYSGNLAKDLIPRVETQQEQVG